jgi:hypothetical protein
MNSTGNPVQLNSFHAADDWFNNTQEELDAIWDNPRSVGKPFMLKSPDINDIHADAMIEISSHLVDKIALEASWTHIVDRIYQQLCPNVVADPATVIQDIHQATTDEKGEKVILKVEEYFNAIQRMTNFLSKTETWTIDVVQHFITHLIDDVRQQISAIGYAYDPTLASCQPYSQITSLQRAFAAASSAEQQINRVKRIAKHEISAQSSVAQVNTSQSRIRRLKNTKRGIAGDAGATILMPTAKDKSSVPTRTDQESLSKQQKPERTTMKELTSANRERKGQPILSSPTPFKICLQLRFKL